MISTKQGLPNNCCMCAAPITSGEWWAANEDEARSGQGRCTPSCDGTKPAAKNRPHKPPQRRKRKPRAKAVPASEE